MAKIKKYAFACPVCWGEDTIVIDSRHHKVSGEIRRRRKCRECDSRWSTAENFTRTIKKVKLKKCAKCFETKKQRQFATDSKYCKACLLQYGENYYFGR